jgi:hypothetical protein
VKQGRDVGTSIKLALNWSKRLTVVMFMVYVSIATSGLMWPAVCTQVDIDHSRQQDCEL